MTDLAKPQSSGTDYLRLENGENKIRIVSAIIDGWECWTHKDGGNQVYRQKAQFKGSQLDGMGVEKRAQKQFYAAIVWNYATERFECMVITQATIKQAIYNASFDPDWGSSIDYDFMISRSGEGLNTSYVVMPKPKKKFHLSVDELVYDLEQLYVGGNPMGDD